MPLLPPWPPLWSREADTNPPGAHAIRDDLSCSQGGLDVPYLPPQIPHFLGGGGGHPLAFARSSQRLRKLPDGASAAFLTSDFSWWGWWPSLWTQT